tara:strand:- start:7863 stop:8543 length:681 start_codon:yes stop_codon:yes gene_type:complete
MSRLSKWIDKNVLGIRNANEVADTTRNMMLNNPMLQTFEDRSNELYDMDSDFYQKGRSFFSDMYGNQGLDQLATQNNAMNRLNARGGIAPGIGFAQSQQALNAINQNVANQTGRSMMDMWRQGQQLAQGYGNQASGIYNNANQMSTQQYLAQDAANRAAKSQFTQGMIGLGMNALAPGLGGLMGMTGLESAANPYLPRDASGNMQTGGFTPFQAFRYGYLPERTFK